MALIFATAESRFIRPYVPSRKWGFMKDFLCIFKFYDIYMHAVM